MYMVRTLYILTGVLLNVDMWIYAIVMRMYVLYRDILYFFTCAILTLCISLSSNE